MKTISRIARGSCAARPVARAVVLVLCAVSGSAVLACGDETGSSCSSS